MKRLMKPLSIFVSLLAMATFAMVGSAVAGNIPNEPSCLHLDDDEQRGMTQAMVGSAVVGNIPYDPSYEHYNYEKQSSMTHATVGSAVVGNIPYDPSYEDYNDEKQNRSYARVLCQKGIQ